MKELFRILRRFVPPYKRFLILGVASNILSAVLNLFSFALIIPILQILFRINEATYEYVPWQWNPLDLSTWGGFLDAIKTNFFYYVTKLIETEGGSTTLIILGLFLTVMTFLKVAAMYLALYTMIPIRTGVVRDIRNQINDKILTLPIGFFSEARKGDILARVSGDVNEVENSIMSSLDMMLKNPILIAIYLIGMLTISWQLTIFVLLLLPISGFVMGRVGKHLKRQSLEGQDQWGLLMSRVEETIGGLRIVKAFNAETHMRESFESMNERFRNITTSVFRRQQMAHPMSEFLGTATIAVVLWYGGTLILSDSSTVDAATFIYYLIIFYSLINPAKELSKASYAIRKGFASMERIDQILCADNPIKSPADPKPISLNDAIRFEDISFSYESGREVIKGISLEVPRGKTVALVGQSGSGKSTLLDLLPRFYDIQGGRITIDGTDIRDADPKDLRSLMGNVSQEAILFNDTFYNNIAFGCPTATQKEVEAAAHIANAHDFITESSNGYQTLVGDRGAKMSGGQRQRISIARAVLKNPEILILDEATSALDTESERLVQEALERLMSDRTTLVVAHRLSTIRQADIICVMHEGKIVEQGRHEELLALDGYYKRLCDMQGF